MNRKAVKCCTINSLPSYNPIMLLFFKACYRDPILRGEKTDTIRQSARGAYSGRVMQACVGPSRIFARLRIVAVESIGSLSAERKAQVIACYGLCDDSMVRLTFELIECQPPQPDCSQLRLAIS